MAKTAKNTAVYLVVDTRESHVIQFLDDVFTDLIYTRRQINIGDYLICRKAAGEPEVLACFERKTWADFAASFKDGRYGNITKMVGLRDQTRCQLFYVLEGPAFPSPNRRFSRIPFANISAAVTKLMIRHGVFVVQTEDERHTAQRLYEIAKAFSEEPGIGPGHNPLPRATTAHSNDRNPATQDDVVVEVPESVTARIEESDIDAVTNMWARLNGVSVVLGHILAQSFSMADLAAQRISPAILCEIKTATGKTIRKDALASLMSLRSGDPEVATKVLSGIKGVSLSVARQVLAHCGGSIARLSSYEPGAIGIISIAQKSRTVKLGSARANRIHRLLHFAVPREGGAVEQERTAIRFPGENVLRGDRGGHANNRPSQCSAPAQPSAVRSPPVDTNLELDDLYGGGGAVSPALTDEEINDMFRDLLQ